MTLPQLNHCPPAAPVGGLLLYSAMVIDMKDKIGNFQFAQTLALNGWLICDGSPIKLAKFPELFRVLGRRYAAGTVREGFFCLPDFRGQFIRAQNLGRNSKDHGDPDVSTRSNAAGEKVGDEAGSWQEMMVQDHSHIYMRPKLATEVTVEGGATAAMIEASEYLTYQSYTPAGSTEETPPQESKLSAKETRPINLYSPVLIRYTNTQHRIVSIGPDEFRCCGGSADQLPHIG